jgi:hypothetical protein
MDATPYYLRVLRLCRPGSFLPVLLLLPHMLEIIEEGAEAVSGQGGYDD